MGNQAYFRILLPNKSYMFTPDVPRNQVEKYLSKLQPLNYNCFRWWRMYDSPNKPLSHRSPLRDRILNGDFDYSHYIYQSYLCEYQLNDLWEECKPDIALFNEKGAVMMARRKRLIEDFVKDENQRFEGLIKAFIENFTCNRETLLKEMENSDKDLIGFYYLIEDKYKRVFTPYPKKGRGRPRKY